jgi:DNA polymerase-4
VIKRTIFHIDINAFFPSVEVIYQPQLANQPFAVGKELRGVICSANYVARTKGVKAGIPCFKAKQLCPNLILIPPHFDLYNQYHQAFVHLLRSRFSNLIEVASIDECYLDVSRMLTAKLTPTILAKQIQDTIQRELCLGVSIGISYNRFLAKMGSNYRKPMGLTVINSEEDIKKLL